MLKGISPILSPQLLAALHEMGHGDELILADAHFPGHTIGKRVIRADGLKVAPLLDAILPLFVIDTYVSDPLVMMSAVTGDELDPRVESAYWDAIQRHAPNSPRITRIDRIAFYERAKQSFAVVMTGELAKYGNIIVKKGVTPV